MPPKNKGNKGKKGKGNREDGTPTTMYVPKENQEGFPKAENEEEKTMETQESQEPVSHKEIPDSTPTANTNAEETITPIVEENVQATEAKIEEAIAETKVEEPVAEVVQENLEKTEERLEEVIQETKVEEPVVETVVQENIQEAEAKIEEAIEQTKVEPVVETVVQENIQEAEAKIEEAIEQTKVEEKQAAPESLEIPAQTYEESRPLSENRLFTIESEGERSFQQQPGKVGGAVENVITEEQEESHDTQRSVLEEPAVQGNLTSSLQQNWEEMRTEKTQDLTKSHVVVENSHDEKSAASAGLQESRNWEEIKPVEKRPSLLVQEHDDDIRSDKASDNAFQTRQFDELPEAQGLAPADRLKRAEEQIKQAKALKDEGKAEEAITLLLNTIQGLNPESFHTQEQTILNEINQSIKAATIELSDCYNQTNDFNQSIKYARLVLKHDAHNTRAVYLLGIGLIRIGDLTEAHTLLREAKNFPVGSTDTLFGDLIDKELEKLDQIAESKSKTPRANSSEEYQSVLARNQTGSVDEVPEEKAEQGQEEGSSERKAKGGSAAEYFLGSLISTSALSFAVAKYLFKFPTKKGVLSALVVGAVVGGVSLIVQSAIKKSDKKDTNAKQ